MDTPAERVKRHVRLRREKLKWTQKRLADEAAVARSTVQILEDGGSVREGKEGAIEEALGWTLGSIERIRGGGEPALQVASRIPTVEELRKMDTDEVIGVLKLVRRLNGPAAADQFRNDYIAMLDRLAERDEESRT